MTPIEVSTALSTLCSLALLWVFFHVFYCDYRVDVFRQKLFALRDDLFDLALTGVVSFEDSAYGLLRSTINGYLRFGHRIRLFSVIYLGFSLERADRDGDATRDFRHRWTRAVSALPRESRSDIRLIHDRMNRIVIEQMFWTSLVAILSVVPLVLLHFADVLRRHATAGLRATWRRWTNLVDTAALENGELSGGSPALSSQGA